MHEVEEMIRIILKPGPQRGRDVIAWVNDASGYSRAKVFELASDMVARRELERGMWLLTGSGTAGQKSARLLSVRALSRLHADLTDTILEQQKGAEA